MTVLSACQSAAVRLVGRKPQSVFSAADQLAVELAQLANDAAADIAKYYDWQELLKLTTVTGDGTSLGFPLPDDYDRMPVKAQVHSSTWQRYHYWPARDLDQWLDFQTYLTAGVPGYWTILDGQMQLQPAIGASEQAKFYYISKNFVRSAINLPKSAFDADTDTFVLDERLLSLAIIWKHRAWKGLEYAEDMRNYEIALSQEVGRDRGPRMLVTDSRRATLDTRHSYPGPLGQ